jgi:hypothetical protein
MYPQDNAEMRKRMAEEDEAIRIAEEEAYIEEQDNIRRYNAFCDMIDNGDVPALLAEIDYLDATKDYFSNDPRHAILVALQQDGLTPDKYREILQLCQVHIGQLGLRVFSNTCMFIMNAQAVLCHPKEQVIIARGLGRGFHFPQGKGLVQFIESIFKHIV